eukprot:CAMPEP_0184544892 /NCGR_PEP_ID=MMETSP0199_2-20130426/3931_1 /TAXON_ID=1112570 /ORGANISM="Thraustochytrium sp., Strain LLF1b" /LENGTH=189 /DNA_ID=CAMNT_0026939125 /DNA_START=197 /DNA_END=766 /DNA_ORIENTATION=+
MGAFVGLRKAGKAHLLMPHQTSIGVGTGWTMASSVLASVGVAPMLAPTSVWHLPLVLLPQQLAFSLSLGLREEVAFSFVGYASICIIGVIAALFLRFEESDKTFETSVGLSVLTGSMLVSTMLPMLHIRVKMLCLMWAVLAAGPVLFETLLPPLPILLVVEQLTLLIVKLQVLETDKGKQDEKAPGWKW